MVKTSKKKHDKKRHDKKTKHFWTHRLYKQVGQKRNITRKKKHKLIMELERYPEKYATLSEQISVYQPWERHHDFLSFVKSQIPEFSLYPEFQFEREHEREISSSTSESDYVRTHKQFREERERTIQLLEHSKIQAISKHLNTYKQTMMGKHGLTKWLEHYPNYNVFSHLPSTQHNYENIFMKHHANCNVNELLDIEALAKSFDYFDIQNIDFDPSRKFISFAVDLIGNRNYYLFIKHLDTQTMEYIDLSSRGKKSNNVMTSVHDMMINRNIDTMYSTIGAMAGNYFWVDSESILYVTYDAYYNVNECRVYNMTTKRSRLLYRELQHRMLHIAPVDSGYYYLLYSSSYNDDKVYLLDLELDKMVYDDENENENNRHQRHMSTPKKVILMKHPMFDAKQFTQYLYIDNIDNAWYALKQIRGNYYLYQFDRLPSSGTSPKKETMRLLWKLVNGNNGVRVVQNIVYLQKHFVIIIRNRTSYELVVFSLCSRKVVKRIGKNEMTSFCKSHESCHLQPFLPLAFAIHDNTSLLIQPMSHTKIGMPISISINNNQIPSMSTIPTAHVHGSLNSTPVNVMPMISEKDHKQLFGRKNKTYDEKTYILKHNTIMITVLSKHKTKGRRHHDRSKKCLVYGYGSYGSSYDAKYNTHNLLYFAERGYTVALVHVSGDGKLGFHQYANGIGTKKTNTFDNFIYACDFLVKKGITTHDTMAIWGRSAGGLLVSAVLNKRPDICKVAILGVPFVTPIQTMSSDKNPLGFESHSEWGDPRDPKVKRYMETYDPTRRENIRECGIYPNMLIYTNINDTLVPYREPVMYYEMMKDVSVFKRGERDIVLFADDKFGHSQGTKLKDQITLHAIIVRMLDKYL
jgi:protease II